MVDEKAKAKLIAEWIQDIKRKLDLVSESLTDLGVVTLYLTMDESDAKSAVKILKELANEKDE